MYFVWDESLWLCFRNIHNKPASGARDKTEVHSLSNENSG